MTTKELFEQLHNQIIKELEGSNFAITVGPYSNCFDRLNESLFWYEKAISLKSDPLKD